MAGVGGTPTSSGGKKSLDAEINLVPFIDLLSVCICFLLMTAVWVQIASVQIKQSHGTEGSASNDYELDLRFKSPKAVQVQIKKLGKPFKKASIEGEEPALLLKNIDQQLKTWISSMPKATSGSIISAAMVTPIKGVSYGELVNTIDVLRKNEIVNLGVVPVGD